MHRQKGFTLAELLIALAILGLIATFTIPKILQSQQDGRYKSAAKEVASTISGAFQAYSARNSLSSGTGAVDLTPYMNYVTFNSSDTIDLIPGWGTRTCDGSDYGCLKLHSGGTLLYNMDHAAGSDTFGGTGSTNAIYFYYDPDGKTSSVSAVQFWLYYNGRLATGETILPNTIYSSSHSVANPCGGCDPTWFNWN